MDDNSIAHALILMYALGGRAILLVPFRGLATLFGLEAVMALLWHLFASAANDVG
jgi:hypothetical protein